MRTNFIREIYWFNREPEFLTKSIKVQTKVLSINDIKKHSFFLDSRDLGGYTYPNIKEIKVYRAKLSGPEIIKKMINGAMILTPEGKTLFPWDLSYFQNQNKLEVYIYRFPEIGEKREIDYELFIEFIKNLQISDVLYKVKYYMDEGLYLWEDSCSRIFPKYSVVICDRYITQGYIVPWLDIFIFENCRGTSFDKGYSLFGRHPNVNYSDKNICYGTNEIGRLDLLDMNLESAYSSSMVFKYNPIYFIAGFAKYILEKI